MTFAAIFAIVAGVGMMGWWSVSLAAKQVPELQTEPVRIRFHMAAEFATAIALILGGAGLLLDASWALNVYLVSIGMLLYTAIVSPGYFAQQGKWPLVGMFAAVVLLAAISLALVL